MNIIDEGADPSQLVHHAGQGNLNKQAIQSWQGGLVVSIYLSIYLTPHFLYLALYLSIFLFRFLFVSHNLLLSNC